MAYNVGDKFKLTANAIDNYGNKYVGKVFTVKQWYDHYCSVDKIASDAHGHPGFDTGAGGRLYSSELPFDVYSWEMIKV